jgi:hypothetical protein
MTEVTWRISKDATANACRSARGTLAAKRRIMHDREKTVRMENCEDLMKLPREDKGERRGVSPSLAA